MSIECGKPSSEEITLERKVWRGVGVVLGLEAVKLIVTIPSEKVWEAAQWIQWMAEGLAIPVWALWGEGKDGVIEVVKARLGMDNDLTKSRGWLVKDGEAAITFLKSKLTGHSR